MTRLLKRFFSVQYMLKPSQRTSRPLPSTREVYRTQYQMSWPSAVESVLVSLMSSVDTMMVGGLGPAAITAVGLTTQPEFVLLAMIFSLNVGVTAVIARRKGENDAASANRCLRQSIVISLLISVATSIPGAIFAKPIVQFAGAGPDTIQNAATYFRILMGAMIFSSLTMTINAAQRGAGNTKIAMKTNVIANIVNITLDYFLIYGVGFFPQLGVAGAAIATLIGNACGFVIALRSLFGKSAFLGFGGIKYSWRFDRKIMHSLFHISSSAVIEQVFMRFGFFTYAKIVASLGTVPFATHQICMNLINLSFAFGDGLGVAASALVGQSLGAKRPDMAIVYGKTGQRMAFTVSSVLFFVFLFGRRTLVGLFSSNPEVLALGSVIMIIIACTTHVQTSAVVFSGCLRGAGDTRYVAFTSFISIGIIRTVVSWALCFPCGLGLPGAWLGLFVDQCTRCILNMLRFKGGKWTKMEA